MSGEEIETEYGKHFETETFYARHRRHGSAELSELAELPRDLLETLSHGAVRDVLFNDLHVYTAETDMAARKRWLDSLQRIRALKPAAVVPGHSKVGAPVDATSAVDFTEKYLLIFEEELEKAKTPDDLVKAMKEQFPSADLLLAIERGAKANVKQ